MRKWLALSAALFIAGPPCLAQAPNVRAVIFPPQAPTVAAAGYTGPGDIVSGAYAWYSCSRAYNTADTAAACNVCLPSDTTCADVTISAGFAVVPGSLSTCNITTVICTVKTAYDKSGNSRNATQAVEANRPTFRPAMASNGCPTTALPCIKFVQASSQRLVGPAMTASQPITISLIYIRGTVTGGEPASNNIEFFTNTGNIQLFAGTTSASVTSADGSWHAVQGVFNNTTSSAYVDGVNTSPLSVGTNSPSGQSITLGSVVLSAYFDGSMGEAGFWAVDFTNVGGIDKRPAINSNQHGANGYNF